ncbi:IS1634 family transposase [Desulfobacterales bacterium HSG17]|nr:IS1634 family transposase [Desulfobacterales bacterium HSG17]
MLKIFGWIFVVVVASVFWMAETTDAKQPSVEDGVVKCGKTRTGSSQGKTSRPVRKSCGEESRRKRVPKPQRNRIAGSVCRKTKKKPNHRNKRNSSKSSQKKSSKTKPTAIDNLPSKVSLKTSEAKRQKNFKSEPGKDSNISEIITLKVGAAPVLKHYIERMGIVSIIDRMIPSHCNRKISHGEMVAAIMVYLLSGGRALYRMEKWAEETGILKYIFPQYSAKDFTDDRIDDTLDALFKNGLEPVQGSISSNIVVEFDLNLDQIHYDTTSVAMWGTYDSSAGQPAVLINFGYSKDHRPDLKQVVVGSAVSGDGGVPLISGTHDGNTNDSVLPISYWERLRQLVGKNPFCFIGDCKTASLDTLKVICGGGGKILATMPMTEAEQKKLIIKMKENKLKFTAVDLDNEEKMKPIYENRTHSYSNRSKEDDVQKKPDSYKVCEESWEITDNKGDKHDLRKLIMYSERLHNKHAGTRERRLEKAENNFQDLRKKLNKRNLKTRDDIDTAVQKILSSNRVQKLMGVEIEEQVKILRKQVGRGKPGPNTKYIEEKKVTYDLKVWRKLKVIKEKALLDGIFLMVSNQDSQQWPASGLLALYKRQYKVEKIFGVLKGPLAVSPMLLEKPERICAMLFVMTLTLQLYTLIQRQAANEILQRDYPLDGLMPNKIRTWRPQTDNILAAFDNINLIKLLLEDGSSSMYMTSLSPLQLEILQLLGVPAKKYAPKTFSQKSEET